MGMKKGDRKSVNHTTGVNVVSRLKQNIEEFPSNVYILLALLVFCCYFHVVIINRLWSTLQNCSTSKSEKHFE